MTKIPFSLTGCARSCRLQGGPGRERKVKVTDLKNITTPPGSRLPVEHGFSCRHRNLACLSLERQASLFFLGLLALCVEARLYPSSLSLLRQMCRRGTMFPLKQLERKRHTQRRATARAGHRDPGNRERPGSGQRSFGEVNLDWTGLGRKGCSLHRPSGWLYLTSSIARVGRKQYLSDVSGGIDLLGV
jgi:hypothetical protein